MKNFNNIPTEMKQYNQWVCWDKIEEETGKFTKLPFNPLTGKLANVSDSKTWVDYETAVNNAGKYSGIGFVLSDNDPFCFIDLDATQDAEIIEKQKSIVDNFNSYTEISPSKLGVHIICKAAIQSGKRKGKIEMYSSMRYMTMTGNIYRDYNSIEVRQKQATELYQDLTSGKNSNSLEFDQIISKPERFSDQEIFDRAKDASNGELFIRLWNGDWNCNGRFPSQSEADLSLMNIIAFYTENTDQCRRLWLQSGLAIREKGKSEYHIKRMIQKAFDQKQTVDTVDTSGLLEKVNLMVEKQFFQEKKIDFSDIKDDSESKYDFPEGIIGEIAQFFYNQSPKPVKTLSLAAAFSYMAGIIGRQYNFNGVGLNIYVVVAALSGTGKEGMASGISKLNSYVRLKYPNVDDFVGPSEIASGPALHKNMVNQLCCLSVLGEVGFKFKLMSNATNGPEFTLQRTLLNFYTKSGKSNYVEKMVYSDKDKEVEKIESPAFSFLGESTPETLYDCFDDKSIKSGLVPRFSFFDYVDGKVKPRNKKHHLAIPDAGLCTRISNIMQDINMKRSKGIFKEIEYTNQADEYLDKLESDIVDRINKITQESAERAILNRKLVNIMKFAAIYAFGCNPVNPKVDKKHLEYAEHLINISCDVIIKRYREGEFGTDEAKQSKNVLSAINNYIFSTYGEVKTHGGTQETHRDKLIPHRFLLRKCCNLSSFKNERLGASQAIKRIIKNMIDSGDIVEFDKFNLKNSYGLRSGTYYMVSNSDIIKKES